MQKRLIILTLIAFCCLCCQSFLSAAVLVKEGSRGEDVRQVQELLIAQGYLSGTADGVCGAKTVEAIKSFQQAAGLTADGVCGQATYERLLQAAPAGENTAAIKPGMRGDNVRHMQELLIAKGYLNGTADGVCGDQTVAAVKSFQQAMGLTPDGICGRETLAALVASSADAANTGKGEYVAIGGVVKRGTYGDGVSQVQEMLIDLGYLTTGADGVCGEATVAAITDFQRDNGLTADGVCGASTYAALGGGGHGGSSVTTDYDSHRLGRSVHAYVTAYSPEDPGNGAYSASGHRITHGIIAVDPDFIPLGTRVYIPGYGEAIASDIGSGIKGNHVDVAFDTNAEAMAFGFQEIEIYILE